jgi:rod shape determining protein RodA
MSTLYVSSRPTERRESAVGSMLRHTDWGLIIATALIAVIGLAAIYAARYQARVDAGLELSFWVKRQGLALALGAVGMVVVMLIDYRRLRDFARFFYFGTAALLAAVLVVGPRGKFGANAWFNIGPFQLQPSEVAKVTLVFLLASYLSNEKGEPLPFERFVRALFLLGLPMGLVLLQPDLGTASTFVVITMAILLIARARARHIALITAMSLISVVALVSTGALARYQQDRLTAFVNQKTTRNNEDVIQQVGFSKQAITLGRLSGVGFTKGKTVNGGYLHEPQTDFIFPVVAEQFGLVGAGLLLMLYAFVMVRMLRIAHLARDHLGTLIAVGALAMLGWHVFENVGMTMGIMPVTGIPLPLVSYGGSSVLAFLVMLGLVQSVHIRRNA